MKKKKERRGGREEEERSRIEILEHAADRCEPRTAADERRGKRKEKRRGESIHRGERVPSTESVIANGRSTKKKGISAPAIDAPNSACTPLWGGEGGGKKIVEIVISRYPEVSKRGGRGGENRGKTSPFLL